MVLRRGPTIWAFSGRQMASLVTLSYGHLNMVEKKLDVLRGHTLTSFVMTLDAPLKKCRVQWEIKMDGGRVFKKFEQARKDEKMILVNPGIDPGTLRIQIEPSTI